jgi:hypothetical protein
VLDSYISPKTSDVLVLHENNIQWGFFVVFLAVWGFRTHGLAPARQAVYHLSHTSNPAFIQFYLLLVLNYVFSYYKFALRITVRSTLMGRPNWSQIIKQAGFKQALLRALSGEVHHPQRAGPEKSRGRNGSPVFISWVKLRA